MSLFDIKKYQSKMDVLHIIDGTNMFCRACLTDAKSLNDLQITIGIFFRMFAKTMKCKPKYCAIVFDSGRENFRHKIYPQYKSNRKKAYIPNEETKLSLIKKLLQFYGFTVIDSKQFEADDIIGSLTRFCRKKVPIRIFSEDKDFIQLIRNNVVLVKGGKIYDKQMCKEKFGIFPKQFIDYLALMGDTVDSIPGVAKWGKGNASKYLAQCGTIEEIKKQTLTKSLQSIHSANIDLLRKLVAIRTDIKVIESLDELKIKDKDDSSIRQLTQKYSIIVGGVYG